MRAVMSAGRGGILDAVGSTPLVRLDRLADRADLEVWAKLEAFNPGGSAKSRSARQIVCDGMRDGSIQPGSTIVESTSGNLGVGLAQTCKYFDLDLICVVDERTHDLNVKTMRALGAEVRTVERSGSGEDLLALRLELVRQLVSEIPGAFWPNQYENESAITAHAEGTMREIDDALNGAVDFLFVATSTTGTLRGCCNYLRAAGRTTQVVAVDAIGSALFGGIRGPRHLPGFGAGVPPALSREAWYDHLVRVGEADSVAGCRRLVEREAILAGASSGAVASAFATLAGAMREGSRSVLVFADGGSGYLDTVYDDDWVEEALGSDALDRVRAVTRSRRAVA